MESLLAKIERKHAEAEARLDSSIRNIDARYSDLAQAVRAFDQNSASADESLRMLRQPPDNLPNSKY